MTLPDRLRAHLAINRVLRDVYSPRHRPASWWDLKGWHNYWLPYWRMCLHSWCWRGQTYQYRCHLHQDDE